MSFLPSTTIGSFLAGALASGCCISLAVAACQVHVLLILIVALEQRALGAWPHRTQLHSTQDIPLSVYMYGLVQAAASTFSFLTGTTTSGLGSTTYRRPHIGEAREHQLVDQVCAISPQGKTHI
jgi:hypothetical protein